MTRTKPLTLEDIKISEDYAMSHPRRRSTRVIYVGVGATPYHHAKKYLDETRENMNLDSINYENIFIVTTDDNTRIEVFP